MITLYVVFAAGSVLIVMISWLLSVKYKRYHGVARFFSFESIFLLVLLNIRNWFRNPFSPLQIISWILLFLSAYLALAGFLILKARGRPESNFENTSLLVRSGLYSYIRHPLYLSLLLLGTGAMLKDPGAIQLTLGTINLIAVYITARIEEKEMIERFGEDYRKYMKESKMFVPFLI
jgi:protein-S-isoprenylcysteine O-methyltransferase Ste14